MILTTFSLEEAATKYGLVAFSGSMVALMSAMLPAYSSFTLSSAGVILVTGTISTFAFTSSSLKVSMLVPLAWFAVTDTLVTFASLFGFANSNLAP